MAEMKRTRISEHKIAKAIRNKSGILIGLLILGTFFAIKAPNFLSQKNLLNVLLQSSISAIVALGMTVVITGGGIDLSVGSVMAISSIVASRLMAGGMYMAPAIAIGILIGGCFGVLNGFIISRTTIAPFIVTLGMQSIARGIVYILCDGVPITKLPTKFNFFGGGRIAGVVPVPVIFMLIFVIIAFNILHRSRFGRHVFAVGSNENTAYLSGVDVTRIKQTMYILCSIFAAIAGIIYASRVISGQPNAGEGYETDAIAATVIGGTSMAGGQGSIIGTVLGALIMGILSNGLNMLSINYYYQKVTIGIVIIGAVYLDSIRNKKN
ncbi:ABC transporter permease [Paenibacillus sp.]|uniref:ABC transporter permease n=1 Tax=Paenibacillus sp. TaxID=58172 RepID=UPI0025F900C3|nr:ABC transporter permease [Paenibacillus sp.]